MNTMELVRFVERANPRSSDPHSPAPLFPSELIGPARQAILCARQYLLSDQRENGSWVGNQTGDASLPSQLIFLLTYLQREDSSLVKQAAATILDQQLPNGGWSLVPDGTPNVSVSVQAYFALKLSGLDPSDERLSRARRVIRRLGGADAADATTRYFLALFAQVNFDCCPSMPPEMLLVNRQCQKSLAPRSVVWSHRPVRDVGIGRGVRELFIDKPVTWSVPAETGNNHRQTKLRAYARSVFETFCRYCERRGWTPLRGRALNRAESWLLKRTEIGSIFTNWSGT
jgi:squalene-hopene/tetraprenyl-beta-curcumene cyclase